MEMLSHAEHKSERLNESICKGQMTQVERQKKKKNHTTRAKHDHKPISHSISATPGAGIEIQLGDGLGIQPLLGVRPPAASSCTLRHKLSAHSYRPAACIFYLFPDKR